MENLKHGEVLLEPFIVPRRKLSEIDRRTRTFSDFITYHPFHFSAHEHDYQGLLIGIALITRISSLSPTHKHIQSGAEVFLRPIKQAEANDSTRVKMDLHLINVKFLLYHVKYSR